MSNYEEFLPDLYKAIADIETVEECKNLLEDLCTYKEVEQMAQRLRSAKLLLEGKTYNEVISETGISSATLSRVSRCVRRGSHGYKKALEKSLK
ncbi:MAG: TrpR-related protein YerC/YecD [Clostridia bacterium]|nr:TrpR-related protein YerC/YecD [Clostridia bacterium]